MNMTEFTKEIFVGDPYKLVYNGETIYGRIVGFDETSAIYNGQYAKVLFATPGGTEVSTGKAYLEKIENQKDKDSLMQYEKLARERGVPLYCGKL